MPALKWTEEKIRAEAAKWTHLSQLSEHASGAYQKAYRLGILGDLGLIGRKSWDESSILLEGSKHSSRVAFERNNLSAYQFACRNMPHVLDTLFGEKRQWTEEKIRTFASDFKTKQAFRLALPRARDAALRLGLMDDLGFSKERTSSDNDAVYIWRAVGQYFNGNPVYKIGVTSVRLGTRRVEQVAKDAGFEFDLICCEPVQCKATELERKLHILGEDPQFSGFDGATEFRALSDSALYVAVSMICGAM